MRPTALFHLYRALTAMALPVAGRKAVKKLRAANVMPKRAQERLGIATVPRPTGPLIWFHGASVGEAKSVLALMTYMKNVMPEIQLLLTSGTATSAQAVTPHLPAGAHHQFAPLDAVRPLIRFLDHWRPDLCVLVESELWPNLLDLCAKQGLPVALLNARLSDRSAEGWKKYPDTAAYVLRGVVHAHCQDMRSRNHLRDMGVSHAEQGTNLKSILGPSRLDAADLRAAQAALGTTPVWVAASTHNGEEEHVLAAHKTLLHAHPSLRLILVPRHPERTTEILPLVRAAGLSVAQRSNGQDLSAPANVYLADTMGETDLWYALSPIVFLGGSFSDVGGHTPFEPAAARCAIVHGPNYHNFSEAYALFLKHKASIEVVDGDALADTVETLLMHPERMSQLTANAAPLASTGTAPLDRISQDLFAWVDGIADAGAPHD